MTVSFDVTNTGARAGKDAPQVYLTDRGGTPIQRLIGFERVAPGDCAVAVGASSADLSLKGGAKVRARSLKP